MKLKGLGRTIKIKPRTVRAIKTRFGCRVSINFVLPEDVNRYELEELVDRIRTILGRN